MRRAAPAIAALSVVVVWWLLRGGAPAPHVEPDTTAAGVHGCSGAEPTGHGEAPATVVDKAPRVGGVVVEGVVADAGGGPIAGARVALRVDEPGWEQQAPARELSALSDATGTYRISVEPGRYIAIASHDDYAARFANIDAHDAPVRRDFALVAGSTIHGTVVARDGRPVANATVRTVELSPGHAIAATAVSELDGGFTLRGVDRGLVGVVARAPGFASGAPATLSLAIGEQVDALRVVVDPAFTIRGVVSPPIAGLVVEAEESSGSWPRQPHVAEPTDETGAFTIDSVFPGTYMLRAGAPYERSGHAVDVAGDVSVTFLVGPAERGGVSGRVEPPVAGVRVDGLGGVLETDEHGAFAVPRIDDGHFTLRAFAPDGRAGTAEIEVGTRGTTDVVIRLGPGGVLAGAVVDDAGHPVAGATVQAALETVRGGHIIYDSALREATTRADGSWTLTVLPGTYRVAATDRPHDEMSSLEDPTPEVTVSAGATQTLRLEIPARSHTLRGRVVDEHGDGLADASVSARNEGFAPYYTMTSPTLTTADGSFEIRDLRAGTYTILAESERGDLRGATRHVAVDGSATVALVPTGELAGRVTRHGRPEVGYFVQCKADGVELQQRVGSPDGEFRFPGVDPGEYRCIAVSSAGMTAAGKVHVTSGRARLELAIDGATVTGTLVDAFTHRPLAGMKVQAWNEAQNLGQLAPAPVVVDAAGHFELHDCRVSGRLHVFSARDDLLGGPFYDAVDGRIDLGEVPVAPPRRSNTFANAGLDAQSDDGGRVAAHVREDGPAARAGVHTGDVIASIDGASVIGLRYDVISTFLDGSMSPGDTLVLGVERDGQPLTFTMVAE